MIYSISKIKFENLKLLMGFYLLLGLCFTLVVKDFNAFTKVRYTAGLAYEFNFVRFLISFSIVFINSVLINTLKMRDFLYAILVLFMIFFILPSAVLFVFVNKIDGRIFLSQNILIFSVLLIGRINMKINSNKISIKSSRLILMFLVIVGTIPYVVLYLPYINLNNLFLQEIYETRELMLSRVNNTYVNYSYSWLNKFIIPCLLVFGLYFRNRATIILCVAILLFLYLCGANKVVFVGLFMVLILYKYDYLKKINFFLKFIIGLSMVAFFLSYVFSNDLVMLMAVRRPLFLPSLLDILYFDFFDNNFIYWSESITGKFIEYPYDRPHSFMVGERYFEKSEWNANNGVISDGFMNYGLVGVLINSITIGMYFSFLSQLNISSKFFGLVFLFVFLLISSSWTTLLLTHGGLVLLILALFFMRDTQNTLK